MTDPPQLVRAGDLLARRISPGDTVRLALVRGPDHVSDASVFFEVWDHGGAQPFNRHARSVESFWFLHGHGVAYVDHHEVEVTAGSFVVLPAGTRHRIVNTGRGRLYAVTTMWPDDGFASLVQAGLPAPLDDDDRAVLGGAWSGPRASG